MQQSIVENWQVIEGAVLPLVTSLILQRHWSTPTKAVVSFAFMLVVAAISAYFDGALAQGKMLSSIMGVLAVAILSFKSLWQPTGIAQSIETATTIVTEK